MNLEIWLPAMFLLGLAVWVCVTRFSLRAKKFEVLK